MSRWGEAARAARRAQVSVADWQFSREWSFWRGEYYHYAWGRTALVTEAEFLRAQAEFRAQHAAPAVAPVVRPVVAGPAPVRLALVAEDGEQVA